MSDESLIRALRALDRPVHVDPGFGDALYATLEGEFARRRQFRPRLTLLLVAALLVALVIGGLVAVGSGLLRLPWTNDRSLIPPGAAGCRSDLPAGQLLELVVNEEGLADPGDEWGPTAGFVVGIYDDGLLLTGTQVGGRTIEQIRAGDSGMTARRLSPTGVQLILDAAEEDTLGSGCHDRWADFPERALSVRGVDGGVLQVAWGRRSDFIRQMTVEEQDAAERFVERLADPEPWLPAEAWVDATERPYVPDRWLINVELSADLRNADPQRGPDAEEVVLPGGTALLAFGDPYQEPDGAGAPGQPGRQGRCALVDTDFARNLAELFADAGAVAHNQLWWFRSGADPVAVHIWPLLPTDGGCTARTLGLAESPGPSPHRPQPSGDLALVDPCGLLSEVSVRTVMAVAAAKPIVITDQTARVEIGRFGDDFRVCSYRLGEIWDDPSVLVHVRPWSTQVAEARVLAHEFLGGDAVEESAADRTVWQNGCPFEADARGLSVCAPAIAISADPYFIVITFHGYLTGDLASVARVLMSKVVTE